MNISPVRKCHCRECQENWKACERIPDGHGQLIFMVSRPRCSAIQVSTHLSYCSLRAIRRQQRPNPSPAMPWKHSRFIPRTTDSSYFLSQSTSRDPSITFPMPLQRRRLAPVPAQQGHSLTANDDLHYNFQVTDYLKKKGFTKTEAIFRQETAYLGPRRQTRPAERRPWTKEVLEVVCVAQKLDREQSRHLQGMPTPCACLARRLTENV